MGRMKIESYRLVPIVADGAIGHPDILDGRILPVLILDCAKHQALEDVIHAHEHTPPGDCTTTWKWKLLSRRHVYLQLDFRFPIETTAVVAFEVATQGALVESIINTRCVYLQPLSSGELVSEGLGMPKILVEVPATTTFPIWDALHRRALEKRYKKKGLSSKQAREAVTQHLARMHDIQFRKKPAGKPL